ncbi:putative N-acetyltransferase YkwB [Paenibacillus baekrokdamisoli]|uniref:Putative N-acetyltransferase YkwB n=1 Tax=Paenibacillus baekrokdamisoli TaxID=1712516 RepID=A0A3G9J7Z3_9BACL|nr:GNAT family N-acetyltransferase [Paenibacillus baekrokdamisoli]MBB3070557.1 ribosomal protein S18 acetylase RimI-like enzyme [Paenibacillus baekrokdamisoli]BBH19908.1 putative N-acetyltransferase YkwB [Paenibacillus baekrokdamisoli]
MRKEMIVYVSGKPQRVIIRNYIFTDMEAMIAIQRESFPPPYPSELWWNVEQLKEHISRFPEGALCAEIDGQLVGSMTALLTSDSVTESHSSWEIATDKGYIRNHDPAGLSLYVVDLCVIPAFRSAGIGKWLIQSMYEVVVHLNLKRLISGGRMPGYHRYANQATAQQYLDRVVAGEWKDPVITFLLRCGRMPIGVIANYLEDEHSCNYAALMEWSNPFWNNNMQPKGS